MARLMTMPAPALMPCIARQNHRCSMRLAKTQPSEAAPNSASAQSMTRRRPKRSEIAPCHRVITAKESR